MILWFDTDAAGQRCTEIISEGLTALDVPFTIMSGFSGCKDANAALCKNKEEFCKMVKDIEKKIEETKEREKTVDVIEKTEYLKNSNVIFLNDLLDEKEKPLCIPTGFPKFDRALNGGLYEGLYVTGGCNRCWQNYIYNAAGGQNCTKRKSCDGLFVGNGS